MKKIYFLILVLTAFVGCSNDDSIMTSSGDNVSTRSATDKIFTVKQIASNVYQTGYTQNYMCTDGDGNLYFVDEPDNNTVLIKKYDPSTDEVSTQAVVPTDGSFYSDLRAICVDNLMNIYYTDGERLLKIIANNGGIVDLTSRFSIQSEYHIFYGLCAASNGNVFVTLDDSYWNPDVESWIQQQKLMKISSNGKITEVIKNIEDDNFYFKGGGVVKPSGTFVYVVQGFGSQNYVKASTTDGTYEGFTTRSNVQSITAALSKAKPYALRDYDIIQLRPDAASDLLVGTIPNYLSDGQGGFIELAKPSYFCSNADATVFYVLANTKNDYYNTILYKVSFD